MTNHQKRLSVPQSWPVERKEETFTVKAGAGPHGEDGVPLLILLRDVLGYVDSRKEARYALNQHNVVINGTPATDEERPVGMFDIVAFREREEFYRVFPDEGGRLTLTPIDEDAAGSKLGKIIGKHNVSGGDVQLTLHDGQTLLVDETADYAVDDSIVVGNEDDDIVAHFVYEEGALATAVAGQHAGQIGSIDDITVTPSSAQNNVTLDALDAEAADSFETIEEYVVVIDENFIADDEAEEAADDEAEATDDEDNAAEAEEDATEDEADAEAEGEAEADAPADSDDEESGATEAADAEEEADDTAAEAADTADTEDDE